MRNTLFKAVTALKTIKELGLGPVGLYAWYWVGLHLGWLRGQTQKSLKRINRIQPGPLASDLLHFPDMDSLLSMISPDAQKQLFEQADEICSGTCRIFSHQKTPIIQTEFICSHDWTICAISSPPDDVKILWEPGRFGWVYVLGMAYLLTRKTEYSRFFWQLSERFFEINPAYMGWQWVSGQEVALRLLSLVFASQVFVDPNTSSPDQQQRLAHWIAIHAARIPPSLSYARSQNNNHLLSEAAGLYSAGLVLPHHPDAPHWLDLGWRWFIQGLQTQISPQGAYSQNSSNYHRLMLQLVIWMDLLRRSTRQEWPSEINQQILAASQWLAAIMDSHSGQVPNLGPNDGAYIIPLTQSEFNDYRPVLQAIWRLFFNASLLPEGKWDDMSDWIGIDRGSNNTQRKLPINFSAPLTLKHPNFDSWCYLRTAHFTSRPGHADLLHLDLWWQGMNIGQDAGTYRYNAPPPWDNSLTHTLVHNTISCGDKEQMQRVGRFLYLNWAHAWAVPVAKSSYPTIHAVHNGYKSLGWRHHRRVEANPHGWRVIDQLIPISIQTSSGSTEFRLHWLMMDYPYQFGDSSIEANVGLTLETPAGKLQLGIKVSSDKDLLPTYSLARAGQLLTGSGSVEPIRGWVSPTYNIKHPALSLAVQVSSATPLTFVSDWSFYPY